MNNLLSRTLRLPCGAKLGNRIAKSGMTEGLADPFNRATIRHARLYRRWSDGGSGLLITGNVMIDRTALERPGNVVLDGERGISELKSWADAGTKGGNHLWMQLNHAGRQSPRSLTSEPVGPSAISMDLGKTFAPPRAISEPEIRVLIGRFADAARLARQSGFTGVQIHAAHGYLISSFLSPEANQRTDQWGGSLENRARLLLETTQAVRRAVGDDFPVSVKLNSADFQRGGFTHEDSLQVARWLDSTGIDLLEISGGNYEQPRLMGYEGRSEAASEPRTKSTQKREAYFLEYAIAMRQQIITPLMVTGGFRSCAAMEQALSNDELDVIGLARPLCTHTNLPKQFLDGELNEAPRHENYLRLGPSYWLGPQSPLFALKQLNIWGQQAWFELQLLRMGNGLNPKTTAGLTHSLLRIMNNEKQAANALRPDSTR